MFKIFRIIFACYLFLAMLFSEIRADAHNEELSMIRIPVSEIHISDGDSFKTPNIKIRLWGIDAFELNQKCMTEDGTEWACGIRSKETLISIMKQSEYIDCKLYGADPYKRQLATCFVNSQDIAETMVIQGMGIAYRYYTDQMPDIMEKYIEKEAMAEVARSGAWIGKFQDPYEYRKSSKKKK